MMAESSSGFRQVAFQHPYSRGTVLIKSSDAFDYPLIDPAYFKSNIDGKSAFSARFLLLWLLIHSLKLSPTGEPASSSSFSNQSRLLLPPSSGLVSLPVRVRTQSS
jgi:hypothetical protein